MERELKRAESSQTTCLQYTNLTHSIPASIRFVSKRDFEQIYAIERDSFQYPWLGYEFRKTLRECGSQCYVVEHDGFIVAYAIIKIYEDCIELCNLAVDAHYRRRRIASLIIHMLKIRLYLENKECIIAYVSERNLPAQLLLNSSDFVAYEVLQDYFFQEHDAYYMEFNPPTQK
jgi:ribosomal protein S18 acetylase RimI-like enzyme